MEHDTHAFSAEQNLNTSFVKRSRREWTTGGELHKNLKKEKSWVPWGVNGCEWRMALRERRRPRYR